MGYRTTESALKLYAVVNKKGEVMFSRGGSSSNPRLMVYDTEAKAKRAMSNIWTKQAIDSLDVMIDLIYSCLEVNNDK